MAASSNIRVHTVPKSKIPRNFYKNLSCVKQAEIVKCVYKHKALYDPSHEKYQDPILAYELWEEIGKKTGYGGAHTRRAWTFICRTFRKFYEKKTLKTGRKHKLYEDFMPFIPVMWPELVRQKNGKNNTSNAAAGCSSHSDGGNANDMKDDDDYDDYYESHLQRPFDTHEFINEIYSYPELYKESHPLYTDEEHTNKMWQRIAWLFTSNVEKCRQKWKDTARRFYKVYTKRTIHGFEKYPFHVEMIRFYPLLYKKKIETGIRINLKRRGINPNTVFPPKAKKPNPQIPNAGKKPDKKQLHALVYQYRELYDRNNPMFNNTGHKLYIWKKIARDANADEKLCKTEWQLSKRILRDYHKFNAGSRKLREELMPFLPFVEGWNWRKPQNAIGMGINIEVKKEESSVGMSLVDVKELYEL